MRIARLPDARLVKAVVEAQADKSNLRRECQDNTELRAELDAARTRVEAMKRSESDKQVSSAC